MQATNETPYTNRSDAKHPITQATGGQMRWPTWPAPTLTCMLLSSSVFVCYQLKADLGLAYVGHYIII